NNAIGFEPNGTENPNVITHNGGNGVHVLVGAGNTVRKNSIHDNGLLGIDLDPAGVNPNGGGGEGPNNLQNYPVLSAVSLTDGSVTGTLNSRPSTTFTIDVYANNACNASGYGEGETLVGTVTTDT